jgi:(p)ppGpp synthase/HD superfamily hydrolase
MIAKAIAVACMAHDGQKYGDRPYHTHLLDVYSVLCRFGVTDQITLSAAWLHDTVEDTKVTESILRTMFIPELVDIVMLVTCNPALPNRKERHRDLYPRTKNNPRAVLVKVADRIANVESGGKADMYLREHTFFRSQMMDCPQATTSQKEILCAMMQYLDGKLGYIHTWGPQ